MSSFCDSEQSPSLPFTLTDTDRSLLRSLLTAIKFAHPDWGVSRISSLILSSHSSEFDAVKAGSSSVPLAGAAATAVRDACKKLYKKLNLADATTTSTGNVDKESGGSCGGVEKDEDDDEEEDGEDAVSSVGTSSSAGKASKDGKVDASNGGIHLFTVGMGGGAAPNAGSSSLVGTLSSADQSFSSLSLSSPFSPGPFSSTSTTTTSSPSAPPTASKDPSNVVIAWVEASVPGDRSGDSPHQAVIACTEAPPTRGDARPGESVKGRSTRGGGGTTAAGNREVFKVQIADNSGDNVILVYNEDRSIKTFIHPYTLADAKRLKELYCDPKIFEMINDRKSEGAEGGVPDPIAAIKKVPSYVAVNATVVAHGVHGANGQTGGRKAFLYGEVREIAGTVVIGLVVGKAGLVEGCKW